MNTRFLSSLPILALLALVPVKAQVQEPPTVHIRGFDILRGYQPGLSLEATEHAWVEISVFRDRPTEVIIATGQGFLEKGKEQVIFLKEDPDFTGIRQRDSFRVVIKASFVTGSPKTVENIMSATPRTPFKLSKQYDALVRITDVTGKWEPTVIVTQPDARMDLVFDDWVPEGRNSVYESELVDSEGFEHKFAVDLRGWEDGFYRYHFQGDLTDGMYFFDQDKTFVLHKDTRPILEGLIELDVDEQNYLTIKFQLSHKIKVALKLSSDVQLLQIDGKGNNPPYDYEARLRMDAPALINRAIGVVDEANSQNPKRPMELSLVASSGEHENNEIGKIRLNVVRIDATKLVSKLAAVSGKVRNEQEARTIAKEALGIDTEPSENSPEDKAIDYVVSGVAPLQWTGCSLRRQAASWHRFS